MDIKALYNETASRLPARSVLLHFRAEVSTGDPHLLHQEELKFLLYVYYL